MPLRSVITNQPSFRLRIVSQLENSILEGHPFFQVHTQKKSADIIDWLHQFMSLCIRKSNTASQPEVHYF